MKQEKKRCPEVTTTGITNMCPYCSINPSLGDTPYGALGCEECQHGVDVGIAEFLVSRGATTINIVRLEQLKRNGKKNGEE